MSSSTTGNDATFNNDAHRKAAVATLASINGSISSVDLTYLSNRPITEVEALKQEVAAVVPAGNIVGLVMSGLLRLRGRTLPAEQAKSDISALLRGLEMLPDNVVYGAFVAGPAAALAAYQKLLILTGKSLDSAFPEGLWQFYLEFSLREDSARHANETTGFQRALVDYDFDLSEADQLAAWVCAVSQTCFQYDDLLYNEWREQTYLNLLETAAEATGLSHMIHFQRLYWAWTAQRPYRRSRDAQPDEDYVHYRRRRFDNFFQNRLAFLPVDQHRKLQTAYQKRLEEELTAYQQQMTILATLNPERYRENRVPIPLWRAQVGVIFQERYYLLPLCQTDQTGRPLLFETKSSNAPLSHLQSNVQGDLCDQTGRLLWADRTGQVYDAKHHQRQGYLRPAQFQSVRRLVAAMIDQSEPPDRDHRLLSLDEQLLLIRRGDQERARKILKRDVGAQELQALKYAPILINWDEQEADKPLAYIRRGKRGVGDQAVTIFRTPRSMVFDQSHIFFDGVWGVALSEIITGEAISWAAYFNELEPPAPTRNIPPSLQLTYEPKLEKFPQMASVEVSAESRGVKTKNLYKLLKILPRRYPDLRLTVNDVLLLYRCEFSQEYHPSPALKQTLAALETEGTPAAKEISTLIGQVLAGFQTGNPSLMIPMNAVAVKPRERLYPTTFRNPFTDLWAVYKKTARVLADYKSDPTQSRWAAFAGSRRLLLAQLDYFGRLLRAYKRVAMEGGSFNTATMKLLAQVPSSLLKLLHEIPQRVDVLNELVKGEEVFSNVGRVARGSSLSRFIGAKYDSDNKALSWGFLTDDTDILHIALREFRPYVATLQELGRIDLAEMIVEDYLDAFTAGFNHFVIALFEIMNANATHVSGGRAADDN